jgi:predicted PurR-regulated permease PerM
VTVYVLVGVSVVGGLTLLAGPFVREATAVSGALPEYAANLRARAPEVQNSLGQYGVQTDLDQLKARVAAGVEQTGTDVLKNLVGTLAEVGSGILDIVLALVISLYLLVDGPKFRARSPALLPIQHRDKLLFVEDHVSRVLGGYLPAEYAREPQAATVDRLEHLNLRTRTHALSRVLGRLPSGTAHDGWALPQLP